MGIGLYLCGSFSRFPQNLDLSTRYKAGGHCSVVTILAMHLIHEAWFGYDGANLPLTPQPECLLKPLKPLLSTNFGFHFLGIIILTKRLVVLPNLAQKCEPQADHSSFPGRGQMGPLALGAATHPLSGLPQAAAQMGMMMALSHTM